MDQSTPNFLPNVGGVVVDKLLFLIIDMWIRSGDIRDQSRKLSEIAQNFGQFFGPAKLLGACLPKIVLSLSFLPRGTSTEKSFVRILPVVRKLLSLTR